jgi:toxin FitB
MIILDTNVLSALMRQPADPKVIAWLDEQPSTSVWTTSITILEIQFGLQILPSGKRRTTLLELFKMMIAKIEGRVAVFDTAAAQHAAELMSARYKKGRPGDLRDTMIAGIALARHATLATGNTAHFADLTISVVNPWTT